MANICRNAHLTASRLFPALLLAALLLVFPPLCAAWTIRNLGTLGGAYCEPLGVNNLGQVVGISQTDAGLFHAFVTAPNGGPLTDLETLDAVVQAGWSKITVVAINDWGQMAGTGFIDGKQRAFFFVARAGACHQRAHTGRTGDTGNGLWRQARNEFDTRLQVTKRMATAPFRHRPERLPPWTCRVHPAGIAARK
ncbi:MAG TPA: hypothetical protein VGK14_14410 [Novimethylophilus sp.]|jgi:probable HAF family extracellular repeat protein|uniref:hypothetical protein n=1 Tax=Novimethylophilus sp. TaxID=2137426 RepID=UPI002F402240